MYPMIGSIDFATKLKITPKILFRYSADFNEQHSQLLKGSAKRHSKFLKKILSDFFWQVALELVVTHIKF